MIKRISRVRDLGIFRDYRWGNDLQDFCRYNLIYGWNGAGKTTLSRLFAALSDGELSQHPKLTYEVTTDSQSWRQGTECTEPIRVFNRDYVLTNIEKVGGPSPIFILGAENREISRQIVQDEESLTAKLLRLKQHEDGHKALVKRSSQLFTDIARTIGQNVGGVESTRSYRRPSAESDFGDLTSKELLADDDLEALKRTLGQQQRPSLDALPSIQNLAGILDDLATAVSATLEEVVSSLVIQRLAENIDVGGWVEQGVVLHRRHSSSHCEFCGQTLPPERLAELDAHFNDADKRLKRSIDHLIERADGVISDLDAITIREPSNLYDELVPDYKLGVEALVSARKSLRGGLADLIKELQAKKTQTTKSFALETSLDAAEILAATDEVNAHLARHNSKTANFDKEKEAARKVLKKHYLSEIFDDAQKLEDEIAVAAQSINELQSGTSTQPDDSIDGLRKRITASRARISSSHAACDEINEKLALFLGRQELAFEVSGDGYEIRRFGEAAHDLSESERTAIAFVYFVVHLSDREFDLANGIVVVDDPISSLDANSLFQAFAFLKESVKGAKQVFILTHNFDFMRQVRNWFFHIKKIGGKPQRSFYMINNRELTAGREAFLAPLDKLLLEFESEYHYLFSLLHSFGADGSLAAIYNFPNIGRKFLETFLAFKVPSHENLHQKMTHIEYDAAKKTAILRFVETHSHAERSDGVLNFDMSLTKGGQTAIRDLLDMIETVDKVHFDTLLATILR